MNATKIRNLFQNRAIRFALVQVVHTAITVIALAALVLGAARVGALNGLMASAAPTAGTSFTTINYQGRLADSSGNPISAITTFQFALYDSATGGNLLWQETQPNVSVSNGLFSVRLGSQSPTGVPASVFSGGDVWLETIVEGETLSPRERLTAVPYAMQAGLALTVPDGAIGFAKLAPDADLTLIQSGTAGGMYGVTPGWTLYEGVGDRSFIAKVTFSPSFKSPPTVVVSLSQIDFINDSNHRVRVFARNITKDGFELVIFTWVDTHIHNAYATWMAYGSK